MTERVLPMLVVPISGGLVLSALDMLVGGADWSRSLSDGVVLSISTLLSQIVSNVAYKGLDYVGLGGFDDGALRDYLVDPLINGYIYNMMYEKNIISEFSEDFGSLRTPMKNYAYAYGATILGKKLLAKPLLDWII